MNEICWTDDKLYMLYKNDFKYNDKLVIPIENLLYDKSYKKFDSLYSRKFNYLYSKKLCWFTNIYNILVLFNNDILEIICQDYDDQIFYINNSDDLLLNNNIITNYFNHDNINDNINDFSTTNLIFDFNNTICDKKNNRLYYFENNIFIQSVMVKFKHYIFNMNENNIIMLLNEINLIKDFNISLFLLNCLLSYKNDLILYILKFNSYIYLNETKNNIVFKFLNNNKSDEKYIQGRIHLEMINNICLNNFTKIHDILKKLIKRDIILNQIFSIHNNVYFIYNMYSNKRISRIKANPCVYFLPCPGDDFFKIFKSDQVHSVHNSLLLYVRNNTDIIKITNYILYRTFLYKILIPGNLYM